MEHATNGVKGGKHVHGAKGHRELVHHIENVAKKQESLDKAKAGHREFVNELYREHGGGAIVPVIMSN
jgi:hypothetical protein